ncbi:MAG: N-acyl homoserine lactonase family protein, partial [Solirubrobacteraceae bacterium]
WTEPLPIYAFAIEHPEGVIVVDIGETARVSEPGYFPRWQPFFRFAVRELVRPEQEIGPQLKQLGILPSDVRRVVMTHLHTDHAGGCTISRTTRSSCRGPSLTMRQDCVGAFAATRTSAGPPGFARPCSTCRPSGSAPSPRASLTQAGDVTLVPVPGHSPGQLAVVVENGDHTVLLAGDSSYTQDALLRGVVDGVGPDEAAERLTYERILAYAAETPTVYLPAHDPDTEARLAARQTIGAARKQVIA